MDHGGWDQAWKGGFSGWDIWGTGTGHPQGGGYIHAQGIISGQHAASSDGSSAYGWMMVGAHNATENRYWLRGKWSTSTSGWVEMITTGNIGSQSVNYASSAGNADTVDGYHATFSGNANTIAVRNGNGYLEPNNWIQFNGQYGLYDPTNGAHQTRNNHSYGSWKMTGERNGWRGLHFGESTGITLMMNEGEFGFHRESVGWVARFTSGTGHFNISGNAASANSATSASYARYLPTYYVGGQQTNPQVYFNNGIGLNVAMTGAWSVWSDTLWINGYAGGDVPWMCALHFLRNSEPRMAISAQTFGSGSYGTYYEVITTYNVANQSVSYANNAGNVSSISGALNGNHTWTNINYFRTNQGAYLGSLDSAKLQVYNDNNQSAFMSFHRGGYYAVNFGLDQDNVMRIGGWSAAANRWQLDMSGNMTVAGDVTAYSDARVKENVETIVQALDKVLQLRGVSYNRTDSDDKKTKIGVIAQETLVVVPEVVNQDNAGMYNVSYGNLAGLFIEAFKEQQKQIEDLKLKLDALTK
jgi:hypothetical protein